ncbi:MAG: hypothetical protein M3505_08045 [Verrucomicrobiota bacterium]|nr:hypothetical protein [Verrucomicrobiota bacterium]
MDRERIFVALATGAAASTLATGSGLAQAPVPPGGPQQAGVEPVIVQRAKPQQAMPVPAPRERWRQMSPEDRQRFRSNAERWLQLGPDERRALRDREVYRRQRMQRDTEEALQRSGLQLEAEKREAYEQRYIQERKKVEKELRQELEARRQRELAPIVEQLKKEFGQSAQGSASPNGSQGSVSPIPKK